ncbi:MAG: transposase [Saprospiraceae bacterium]|jgi:transposase
MGKIKSTNVPFPEWVTSHKKPGTEIKFINGKYYLYGVRSVYDKTIKRARKISLGIVGSITEKDGFIPSSKNKLREEASRSYAGKQVFSVEYGYAKWLVSCIDQDGTLQRIKNCFPELWQFIVAMVYCRTAYQSKLKNIPFHLLHSDLCALLGWDEKLSDQKVCDYLFALGGQLSSIHKYMEPEHKDKKSVLVDATDIVSHSQNLKIAKKGYNSKMDFNTQFVLLYLYDATTLQPLYYRILPGNIREITAFKNTIAASGIEHCIFMADKGFYSESNISEMENCGLQYIITLKRGNKLVPYKELADIELGDNHFQYAKRHVFYADQITTEQGRTVCLFLDGMLKEQEKNDYLSRIKTLPEYYSKEKFKEKVNKMGTLAIIHNTELDSEEIYQEYKQRGNIEQFFDHLKNTLDASSSCMQREESLNGWMFINHISMQVIYKLYKILKTTPLNKKQTLNHKYSIMDSIDHLKTIKKVKFTNTEYIITEADKATRILLEKMSIDIT